MAKSSFFSGTGVTPTATNAIENSVSDAATSATQAANSATSAATSALAATQDTAANAASAAASEVSRLASEAAKVIAVNAQSGITAAQTAAQASQVAAATSEANSLASSVTAATKASEAATSATNSATSGNNAATSATASEASRVASVAAKDAAVVAQNAAETAETNAETAETNSASSAAASANSATASANSATASASSLTASANSASTAATKAAEALASQNSATASASTASTARTATESARDTVIANIASFDNIYLGAKSSAPTSNNSGGSLVEGSLYYDNVGDSMKVWDGTAWLNAYASLSGALLASNNLNDLANVATSRASLGLGTAATTDASAYATASQADQTVALTGGGTTTVTGTYPNFTISSSTAIPTGSGATGVAGQFRYNTTEGKFEGYTTEWGEIGGGAADLSLNQFTGDGSDVTFALSGAAVENNTLVYLDGVYQSKSTYTVSSANPAVVTFSTAPASGTAIEIMVAAIAVTDIGTPADNTVTTAKIADDAVTQAKIADDAVGADQLSSSSVGADQLSSSSVVTASLVDDAVTAAKIASEPISVGITTVVTSASLTATVNTHVYVSAAGRTITLPASPTIGQRVLVTVGNFEDTVIGRNSSNIMSSGTDMTLDKAYLSIQFVYTNSTVGWAIS